MGFSLSLNIDDAMIKAAPETPVDPPAAISPSRVQSTMAFFIKLYDVWAHYLLLV